MRNVFITTLAAMALAGAAYAGDVTEATPVTGPTLTGGINLEVTENAAGDYVATTTLDVGIAAEGLAFGSATVESVDGATFEIDEWYIGTHVGAATVSFGDQGSLFVENDFEIVGGDTLAFPADDHESLIVSMGDASVMIGLTDVTTDVTDVENVQGSYAFTTAGLAVTAVGDYNFDSEEYTVGAKTGYEINKVALGGIVTYGSANEVFAYEASAGYGIATAFVNGDDGDMLQNVGAGVNTTVNGLGVYAEGSYNIDAEDTTFGAGLTLNF